MHGVGFTIRLRLYGLLVTLVTAGGDAAANVKANCGFPFGAFDRPRDKRRLSHPDQHLGDLQDVRAKGLHQLSPSKGG
jgi:hypothetical protein